MMEQMAAAIAAMKLESVVMAAVTESARDGGCYCVENDAQVESVAMLQEVEVEPDKKITLPRRFGFMISSALGMEPDNNIVTVAVVVDAMLDRINNGNNMSQKSFKFMA
ncbi:hypothetical protein HN51_016150 [Arachis hypogaea]